MDSIFIRQFQHLARENQVVLIVPFFERAGHNVRSTHTLFPRSSQKEVLLPGGQGLKMKVKQPKRKGFYNTVAVIDADGEIRGTYRKMHIPDDPCFYEKFYFTPGDLGFKTFKTRFAHIGVLICWDQWFPESARIAALKGADILFYPTAIGWHQKTTHQDRTIEREAWQLIQRSHSLANGIFVASTNRVGREGQLTFWGSSFVSDPFGQVIEKASQTREAILMARCDLKLIDRTRKIWPFLRDRRIHHYQGLQTFHGSSR